MPSFAELASTHARNYVSFLQTCPPLHLKVYMGVTFEGFLIERDSGSGTLHGRLLVSYVHRGEWVRFETPVLITMDESRIAIGDLKAFFRVIEEKVDVAVEKLNQQIETVVATLAPAT